MEAMIPWAVVFFLLGLVAPSIRNLVRKPRVQMQSVRVPEYDKSPAAILSRLYGCSKEHIIVRPLIPEDVNKTSWVWQDNEIISTPCYRLLELTGIDCHKWAAVSLFNNEIGSIRVGLLTSWDNTASVIIKPQEMVYIRQMEIGDDMSDHFALRGKVYEPEGAYIV